MSPLFVPILQMTKLRPREVKEHAQCCTAGSSEPRFELWGSDSNVHTLNYGRMLPLGKYSGSLCWALSVFQAVRGYGRRPHRAQVHTHSQASSVL